MTIIPQGRLLLISVPLYKQPAYLALRRHLPNPAQVGDAQAAVAWWLRPYFLELYFSGSDCEDSV